jgi:serine/threonine-protein kinase HipA
MLLGVSLGNELVGELSVVRDVVEFRLLETYRTRYPRQVLGQTFEDDLDYVHRSRIRLPPFFANLLPEGALRELLARQLGIKAEREPHLLAHLGDDLPGAVRVAVLDGSDDEGHEQGDVVADESPETLKFSLAGVQLKFSALHAAARSVTIPAHGKGGDWIVKLPDPRWIGVPENEWSIMTLARAAGLDVATVELVPLPSIEGLPAEVHVDSSAQALAVKRFDRQPSGLRVHMEDFAQVLNVRPTRKEKYGSANFETLARIIARVAPRSIEEFVRRLVFNAAMGNGDAHIKNWSLLYPDGINPVLSPAYDLVSTIQYLPADDLGLNLARSKRFEDVSVTSFERLKDKAQLSIDVTAVATDMARRIREEWSRLRSDLPMSESEKLAIEAHWERVPLVRSS